MNTIESRMKIGFPKVSKDWTDAPAVYDEHTLKIAGHPVMEDWEADYMEKLASIATRLGGTILELGYGMGLSARAIQKQGIKEHYVIECHPDVMKRCVSDFHAEIAQGSMHILSGFWQEVTPMLKDGMFDGILFDTYPLKAKEVHTNHFWFFEEAYRLLKDGGILTYYSDEVSDISPRHMHALQEAGFKRKDIRYEVCQVHPPDGCEYWQARTIVAPIVKKSVVV